MTFDPWNGRRTVSVGGTSPGDAPSFAAAALPAPAARRPAPALTVPPAAPPRAAAPPHAALAYTISGAPRREPDRSGFRARWQPSGAPAAVAPPPPPPSPPRAAPTLSRGAGSIPHDLTATWDATGGGKTTTIAP